MKHKKIHTKNLELTAATFEHICAELESHELLSSLLKTQIDFDWPPGEYDRDAQKFFYNCLKKNDSSVIGWYIWYAIRRATKNIPSLLIGAGGYFGPPNKDGSVEIGFSIVSSERQKGYATEIAKALVKNAFNDERVNKVIAHTTFHNEASCKVLNKSGFRHVPHNQESDTILFEILRQ